MVYLLTTTAVAIVNNIPCHNFCRSNVCDIILLLIEMTNSLFNILRHKSAPRWIRTCSK